MSDKVNSHKVDLKTVSSHIDAITDNINKAVFGADRAVKLTIAALIAGGHVIVEDVPGVGKTTLALATARSLDVKFRKLQFVADLLPADLIGISVFNPETHEFSFKQGPVFTNFLLADEINRGTPRVQSALLEVMNSSQVTVDGIIHKLKPPFFVMATLNPMESSGVYELPESQLDRFMIRFAMGYPAHDIEQKLLSRENSPVLPEDIEPVVDASIVDLLKKSAEEIRISDDIISYIMSILTASRNHSGITLGASPRAGRHLASICRAWAMLDGRDYVVPDDVKELAVPTLAHRLLLKGMDNRTSAQEQMLIDILSSVTVPA